MAKRELQTNLVGRVCAPRPKVAHQWPWCMKFMLKPGDSPSLATEDQGINASIYAAMAEIVAVRIKDDKVVLTVRDLTHSEGLLGEVEALHVIVKR
jgi:hypothetical protein